MSAATVVDLNRHRQARSAETDPISILAVELGLDPASLTPTDWEWLAHEHERNAFYRSKSRAENTLTSYSYWCGRWERWCTDPSVRSRENTTIIFEPWPARTAAVRMFLTDWVGDGYLEAGSDDDGFEPPSPSTVAQFLSALRWKHRQDRHPEIGDDVLADLVRGLRRAWLEAGFRVRRAEPLLLEGILQVCGWLQDHRVASRNLRDGAVVACHVAGVGLSDMGRASIDDLPVEDGSPIGITVITKTGEQFHEFTADGRQAVASWLDRYRADVNVVDGDSPLLPTIRPDGTITADRPSRQQIRGVLRRVARLAGHDSWSTGDDLTPAVAEDMFAVCRQVDPAVVRDHSLILNAFWGALRRSEATGLDIGKVDIRPGTGVTLDLGITKNNQLGVHDSLAFVPVANGPGMDAVAVNQEWVGLLEQAGDLAPTDPYYRRISRTGIIAGRDDADRGRLDKGSVNDIIRRRLIDAGIATDTPEGTDRHRNVKNYTGHSPRRGLITTLAEAGYEAAEIARYSRHTDPRQLQVYVDNARLADPSRHPAAALQALREPPPA